MINTVLKADYSELGQVGIYVYILNAIEYLGNYQEARCFFFDSTRSISQPEINIRFYKDV